MPPPRSGLHLNIKHTISTYASASISLPPMHAVVTTSSQGPLSVIARVPHFGLKFLKFW
ncbi:hypothetical protein [Oryza sativa Japonica Group]|uniref:Uncharacterized protein n=1 Tax=Oryza sativa subsp. japonica TaxID=39947 RepID=Q5ZB29_ORYSJ|nr:hypothetical protein [Oryza sativa Japonica Group]